MCDDDIQNPVDEMDDDDYESIEASLYPNED